MSQPLKSLKSGKTLKSRSALLTLILKFISCLLRQPDKQIVVLPAIACNKLPQLCSIFRLIGLCGLVTLGACGGGDSSDPDFQSSATQPYPILGLHNLSGSIQMPSHSITDADTNDPTAPYLNNSSLANAQVLPNPFTLGGYVNIARFGPQGRSFAQGDVSDFYRLEAQAGQAVTLTIGQADQGNLELYLYNEHHQLVDQSVGRATTKSVVIAQTGTYFVQVDAQIGASTYLLTLGAFAPTAKDELRASDDFVPGQLIVRWKDNKLPSIPKGSKRSALGIAKTDQENASHQSLDQKLSSIAKQGYRALSVAQPNTSLSDILLQIDTHSWTPIHPQMIKRRTLRQQADPQLLAKIATLEAIEELRQDPDIEYAEPNFIRHAQWVPNDPLYPQQWHYDMIELPKAWDITTGSHGVIVAVLDTGVLLEHPDMKGQWVDGFDFVSSIAQSMDGDGIDADPNEPIHYSEPQSSSTFHGTHVAGTIAALTNNSQGIASVAPGVRIMPIRVLGKLGGTSFDLQQGIRYAAGLSNTSGFVPAQRADIINLSLGGEGYSHSEQNVINLARSLGVIVVGAAGNENTLAPRFPAAYSGVIGVSAVASDKSLASYSNFGSAIDVAAPGGERPSLQTGSPNWGILSAFGQIKQENANALIKTSGTTQVPSINLSMNYAPNIGTSMAAPHVTGVIALMKSVAPTISPSTIDILLQSGQLTTDLGPIGQDSSFGHGLIDAHKALSAALEHDKAYKLVNSTDTLVASPSTFDLAPHIKQLQVSLNWQSNNTTTPLAVQPSITINVPWLLLREIDKASNSSQYTFDVSRGKLAPGQYLGQILFATGQHKLSVVVLLRVAQLAPINHTIHPSQTVYLHHLASQSTVRVAAKSIHSGAYSFEFNNLATGDYWLYSGNDLNFDGELCDLGEICGSFGNTLIPQTLTIQGDLKADNFAAHLHESLSQLPAWKNPSKIRSTREPSF